MNKMQQAGGNQQRIDYAFQSVAVAVRKDVCIIF